MSKPVLAAGAAAVALACVAGATGCAAPARERVVVLAAASLKPSFDRLKTLYEERHPGVDVVLSYGASSTLAGQLAAGAPADVFASASPANMEQVVAAGRAREPRTFATNTLTAAVAPGNPARLAAPADLARPGVKVAVCAAPVPCGALASAWQTRSHTTLAPVTQEPDAGAVLTKVRAGEVDAGLVYVTDARAAAGAGVTELPLPGAPTTSYPIAALTDRGREFAALVTSAEGRDVLRRDGFA